MIFQTILLVLLIGYLVFYLSSRTYLEAFSTSPTGAPGTATRMSPPEKPYSKRPIDSLDQYEHSAVYQNQGTKEASQEQLNQAMARYPMDWAQQGQGSQYYQEQASQYKDEKPVDGYRPTDPTEMMLPDSAQQEAEERKILQTYKPEKSANLLNYSVDDVKTLVEKLFDKRGQVADVVPSKQGQNVWEITEVRDKNPKIVWEDDPAALAAMGERDKMIARREETIDVPYTVSDLAAGLDPFFQKGQSVRDGRFDYTQWTPGLERMFAPTYPIKEWL